MLMNIVKIGITFLLLDFGLELCALRVDPLVLSHGPVGVSLWDVFRFLKRKLDL